MHSDCVTNTGSVDESVTRWVAGARFCVWSCAQGEVVVSNIPSPSCAVFECAMARSTNYRNGRKKRRRAQQNCDDTCVNQPLVSKAYMKQTICRFVHGAPSVSLARRTARLHKMRTVDCKSSWPFALSDETMRQRL